MAARWSLNLSVPICVSFVHSFIHSFVHGLTLDLIPARIYIRGPSRQFEIQDRIVGGKGR